MGNHEYWDTPEHREAEAKRQRDERRREIKVKVLRRRPASDFSVDELRTLLQPPGGYNNRFARSVYTERDEKEFDAMLARLEPRREWGCDIDHDGPCNLACGEP